MRLGLVLHNGQGMTPPTGECEMEMTFAEKQAQLAQMDKATLAAIVRVCDVSLHTVTTAPQHWRDLKAIATGFLEGRR